MSTDQTVPITFRLPAHVKEAASAYSEMHDMSLNALAVEAIKEYVAPQQRTYELVGLSARFDAFLESNDGNRKVILLVATSNGARLIFEGSIELNITDASNGSMVALRRRGDTPWMIPRRDVVGWFDARGAHNSIVTALQRDGWTAIAKSWDALGGG